MSPEAEDLTVMAIHEILSDPLRRRVVYEVQTAAPTQTISLTQLGNSLLSTQEKKLETLYKLLYHRHLPYMKERDAVKWNSQTGQIEATNNTECLYDYMMKVEGGI